MLCRVLSPWVLSRWVLTWVLRLRRERLPEVSRAAPAATRIYFHDLPLRSRLRPRRPRGGPNTHTCAICKRIAVNSSLTNGSARLRRDSNRSTSILPRSRRPRPIAIWRLRRPRPPNSKRLRKLSSGVRETDAYTTTTDKGIPTPLRDLQWWPLPTTEDRTASNDNPWGVQEG